MQIPGRCSSRCLSVLAVAFIFLFAESSVYPSENADTPKGATLLTTHKYFWGSSKKIVQMIKEDTAPYRMKLGGNQLQVEDGSPPPPCGLKLQNTFTNYCVSHIKVQEPVFACRDQALKLVQSCGGRQ